MFNKYKSIYPLIVLIIILAACGPTATQETPEPVVETLVVTEVVEATPVETIQVISPTPEPEGPRTLVICLEEEPFSLNIAAIGGAISASADKVFSAILDGPIDENSFAFQPVILEKLPSLADGDAALTVVNVSEGDTVVDAEGEVVTLDPAADPPIMLVPAGGGVPVPYQGGEFQLNQLSATFKLLPGLLWSDGEPLTAADSVYGFNLLAEKFTYESGTYLKTIRTASYEALDDQTLQWTGVPGFLDHLYFTNFFDPRPEHIWSQYPPAELLESEALDRTPVGWGPYELAEWIPGESITLHKNPNYFRADEGLPKFDRVIFRFTGVNPNTNISAILSGECDLVSTQLDDQMELLLELHEAGRLKATFSTGTVWEHLDFGIQHLEYDDGYQPGVDRPDFFSDVRTRQAFALCMDRQELVDTLFYGQSMVPDSYVPPQHPLFNPEVRHYEFDPVAGSALLEEVGWLDEDGDPQTPRVAQDVPNVPDGTPLEVDYETTSAPIRQQVTSVIKDSLAQCGIKANIQLYDANEWFSTGPDGKLFGRRYDLGQFTWTFEATQPCELYLSRETPGQAGEKWVSIQDGRERTISEFGWGGDNQIGFANEKYDQACSTALHSLPGQPEYEAAHLEAQNIFADQLPSVPLYLRIKITATRPDMCGVIMDPSAMNEFWNIEEFDYGEGCQE
jgi:peptide/nickel transport system substrate-binding protein